MTGESDGRSPGISRGRARILANPKALRLALQAAKDKDAPSGEDGISRLASMLFGIFSRIPFRVFVAFMVLAVVALLAAFVWVFSDQLFLPPGEHPQGCLSDKDCKDRIEYGCRNEDVYKYTTVYRCTLGACKEAGSFIGLFQTCGAGQRCLEGFSVCTKLPVISPSAPTMTSQPKTPGKCSSRDDCPPDRLEYGCDLENNVVEYSYKYFCALYSGSKCIVMNSSKIIDRCGPDTTCIIGKTSCTP